MLIRRVRFTNFRQYRDTGYLDLSVDWGSDKNIVLIGGLNGAGKTSFLEALRLGIFGKLNQDLWRGSSYKSFMRECMNRKAAKEGAREIALTVEMEIGDVNTGTTLTVERRWRFNQDLELHQETLRLSEDGKEKLGLANEDAEVQVLEQIPFGVAQFVFFDGEKIQELATDDTYGEIKVEAIKNILGLRLYQTLEQDLWVFERTLLHENADSEEFEHAEQAVERNRTQLEAVQAQKAAISKELEELQNQHDRLTEEQLRIGVRQVRERHEVEDTLTGYRQERERLQQRLSEVVSSELQLMVLRPLLIDLKMALAGEAEAERQQQLQNLMGDKKAEFLRLLADELAVSSETVANLWERAFFTPTPANPHLHKELSLEQKYALIAKIEGAQCEAAGQLEQLVKELDLAEYKVRRLQQQVRDLPSDPYHLELSASIRKVSEEIRVLSGDLGGYRFEEKRLQNEKAVVERQFEAAAQRVRLSRELQRKVECARAYRETVAAFIQNLADLKVAEVQRHLNHMFHRLQHKEGMVREFIILPGTFGIEVVGPNGERLSLRTLSAGEKEVFAISLLWALGKAAVRELPLVIDTPLGRLDGLHREHIAKNYLPEANRQVIVLSTDTEINEELYADILPFVEKAYRLVYDKESQMTRVEQKYLFGGTEDVH